MLNESSNLKALREALAVSADNIPLLKMYGRACLEHWSLLEAREAYEKILKLNPQDQEAELGISQVLFQMGRVSEAFVRTENILQKNPNFAPGYVLLSKLHLSEGKVDIAKSFYEKAREIDPAIEDGSLEKDFKIPVKSLSPPSRKSEKITNVESGWHIETPDDSIPPSNLKEDGIFKDQLERPKLKFADVGGMKDIKEEIRMKIIYPLHNPELFKAYGKKIGGGVLLYGPPGCGKTLISRATAGEIKASYISIGLHQILDMYIGNSEKNLHELFELARINKPSILFVDEIDALAANRNDFKQSAARTLINQFLAELDGDINSNEGVLILGATNAPWHIDPAFRRPGRFDRIIFIPTPDEAARIEIIKILVRDKPIQELDVKALAKVTESFSGADLKSVFDLAVEVSLSKAMKENRLVPITTADLLKVSKSIVPSSRAWFESAKNYALYANQSGLYDPILAYLGIKK